MRRLFYFVNNRIRVFTLDVSRSFPCISRHTPHAFRLTNRGFSFLEFIGVIAVIAILGAVISPAVINHLKAAVRDAEITTLQGIAQGIEVYLRETHAWPPDLASLSPDYLPTDILQLTRNDAGFPRYFFVHPDVRGLTNATGLSSNELDDAQYLLISSLIDDAAPTITNAAEFDAWWDTDETSTPDLKIHRGQVSDLYSLLTLEAPGARGAYRIEDVTTNWDCRAKPALIHTKYHLAGTMIALDEVSPYGTPEVQFSLMEDRSYRYDPCHAAGSRWRTMPASNPECWSLWMTTATDVPSPSGAPCLDSWQNGEVLQFGMPDLAGEPGLTSGTLSSAVSLDGFSFGGVNGISAIHYVTTQMTIGVTTTMEVKPGDLLLSTNTFEALVSNTALTVGSNDLFIFRPDKPGDYSSGTFLMLLHNFTGWGIFANNATSISLIERTVTVGDVNLQAGTFIFSEAGGNQNNIQYFVPMGVGLGTTSGTTSTLINGSDIDIGVGTAVVGLDVIEEAVTFAGTTLQPGYLLITLGQAETNVGMNDLDVGPYDIFYLDISATTMGSGATVANATLLLEGADVGLNTTSENIQAVSLAPTL
ncbi:MAG: hypothetical protein MRJ96_03685 [Nitrospirales bacterium]|nr:hypothetical protein [Nitrospira sp.]MDR4500540.1 hypothetical protein [Nitrospirales bacterium]